MTKTRNHSQYEHGTLSIIILTNRITRAAIKSVSSQGASSLTFKKLKSTLEKRRRLHLPLPLPETIE